MIKTVYSWLLYTWGGLHRYFGNTNNIRHEHERAVHYFTRAYQVDPSFYQARLARAVIFWRELRRYEEALADLNGLLAERSDYAPALFNRAMVFQENGRFQDAAADLEAYLQLPDLEYADEAARMLTILRNGSQ